VPLWDTLEPRSRHFTVLPLAIGLLFQRTYSCNSMGSIHWSPSSRSVLQCYTNTDAFSENYKYPFNTWVRWGNWGIGSIQWSPSSRSALQCYTNTDAFSKNYKYRFNTWVRWGNWGIGSIQWSPSSRSVLQCYTNTDAFTDNYKYPFNTWVRWGNWGKESYPELICRLGFEPGTSWPLVTQTTTPMWLHLAMPGGNVPY
jgi:hypothetical protein